MQLNTTEWRSICEYEDDLEALGNHELRALSDVWMEQRNLLEDQEAIELFTEKLKREQAIETGLIEGLYEFDRGITEFLIEHGIDTSFLPHGSVENPELVISMISDQKAAIDGLFDFVKDNRALSTSYIKELHALLTQNQESVEARDTSGKSIKVKLLKGEYKQLPNNPKRADGTVHQYCPPEHVAAEMDYLIEQYLSHEGIMPEVQSAWLHHRFTQIHPFQDGNGRVARALATLVFLKKSWFPLVVKNSDREKYITALEKADAGNLSDLVSFFSSLQKKQFVLALGLAREVLDEKRIDEVIYRTSEELKRRKDALKQEWETAKDKADKLRKVAFGQLKKVVKSLEKEIQPAFEEWAFFVDQAADQEQKSHYFHRQIVETAKAHNYFANTTAYRSWTRLVFKTETQCDLLVSFHSIGREFRGVLACTATWFQRSETEDGEREVTQITALSEEMFQINYKEEINSIQQRFKPWLENSIVTGLKLWQKTIL